MKTRKIPDRKEVFTLVGELERELFALGQNLQDHGKAGDVSRTISSICSSCVGLGFNEIAALTDRMESVCTLILDRRLPVTDYLLHLALAACSQIRDLLNDGLAGNLEISAHTMRLMEYFGSYVDLHKEDRARDERGCSLGKAGGTGL